MPAVDTPDSVRGFAGTRVRPIPYGLFRSAYSQEIAKTVCMMILQADHSYNVRRFHSHVISPGLQAPYQV